MTVLAIDLVWPYATMLGSSFAGATLLPLSSEAVLLAQLQAGFGAPLGLLVAATAGNTLGSLLNWWLGANLRRFETRRWFPFKPEQLATASRRFNAWGAWTLLLAWLPVVGDPLTCVAGLMRVPLTVFLPLVVIGKAGRYIAIVAMTQV